MVLFGQLGLFDLDILLLGRGGRLLAARYVWQRYLSSLSVSLTLLLAFHLRSLAGWYDSLHLICWQGEVRTERHLDCIVAALDLLAVGLPELGR